MSGTGFQGNDTNATSAVTCLLSLAPDSSAITAIKILAYCLVFIMSLAGNLLIIAVVFKNVNMRTAINFFIVNMACSDLSVPVFAIPIRITEVARGRGDWLVGGDLGNALCKISFFLTDISPTVSILSLIIITIERFAAVVFPMHASVFTNKVCGSLIALTWIVSVGMFSPYFYAFRVHDSMECMLSWEPAFEQLPTHVTYVSIICIAFVIIPFFVLTVLYTVMIQQLWKGSKRVSSMQANDISRNHRRRNVRVFYMSLAIVVIFGVCWGPFNCFMLVLNFHWRWKVPGCNPVIPNAFFVVQFLTFCNASANPCVYFVFVSRYRTGLRKLCARNSATVPIAALHTGFANSSLTASARRDVAASAAEVDEDFDAISTICRADNKEDKKSTTSSV